MASESLRPQAEDFPSSHVPGDLLVPFASLQKELAAAAAKLFYRIFRRLRTATYFARVGKVGKTPPGDAAFGKDLRLTPWSFRRRFPPDPRFTGV